MNAILLAAGFGTRLRPLTDTIPKCLVSINGRPLLSYWLELLLIDKGIKNIFLNTHYLAQHIEEYIASSPWKEKVQISHEYKLLGTGGTMLSAEDFIGKKTVMVVHADNLSRFSLKDFIKSHSDRPKHCAITMMIFRTDKPKNCGILKVDNSGVAVELYEKVGNPPGNLANGAVYIFEPEVLDFLKSLKKNEIDLSTDVLPHFLGRINTFLNADYHRDIGTYDSLKIARNDFNT
jgi:mannose-1-phosphate guanylyltransferase